MTTPAAPSHSRNGVHERWLGSAAGPSVLNFVAPVQVILLMRTLSTIMAVRTVTVAAGRMVAAAAAVAVETVVSVVETTVVAVVALCPLLSLFPPPAPPVRGRRGCPRTGPWLLKRPFSVSGRAVSRSGFVALTTLLVMAVRLAVAALVALRPPPLSHPPPMRPLRRRRGYPPTTPCLFKSPPPTSGRGASLLGIVPLAAFAVGMAPAARVAPRWLPRWPPPPPSRL